MEPRKCSQERTSLVYPQHLLKPQDVLDFIELHAFTARWDGLRLSDEALQGLQIIIMSDPLAGELIEGTGDLRRLWVTFSPYRVSMGGDTGVYYVYFEPYSVVLLVTVRPAADGADLSVEERDTIRLTLGRVWEEFSRRPVR